ncbi:MAG: DNA recombination protein RmuC [Breznakia sp.]
MESILLFVLVILSVVILFTVFSMRNTSKYLEEKNKGMMQSQVSKQLLDFQTALSSSVHRDMDRLNESTSDKLFKMEHNVNRQLHTAFESTHKTFAEVMKQIVKIDQTQEQLRGLGSEITGLHQILNDKKTRGIYGEIELYSILECAFANNIHRYQRQYRLRNNLIVDAVIFGNDALGMIPIDSKFPLENFNRLMDVEHDEVRKKVLQNQFKTDIKKHIDAIATKYIVPNETSEFAYMFIPAEAIFAYVNAQMEDVVSYSYTQKVYLVSPTTLMAYITAIKALYLDQKKNAQMKDIQEELQKLSKEFERFSQRYEKVQKDYERVYQNMKELDITNNKIINRFKKIEAVELEDE